MLPSMENGSDTTDFFSLNRAKFETALVWIVLILSMIANAETTQRYVSRVVSGWTLGSITALTALLPLACLVVSKRIQQRLYPWIVVLAAGLCVVIWHLLPVESLRVDRWELMSNFLHRLFRGDYPYLASSHLNVAPPAPFPWLYLVGIPAWAVGEIGWFPLASLVVLVFAAPKSARPFLVFALATSLPVWYEIVVRSNIVANAALVGAFLLTFPKRDVRSLVVSGVLGGIVLCTRASFTAPILVWAGAVFLAHRRWKDSVVWGAVATVVVLLPFALLIAIWGWPVFRDWNPLRVQSSIQAPWIPIAALLLAPWVGRATTTVFGRVAAAFVLALVPMLSFLIPSLLDGTFWTPTRGYFEVAFWNTALVLGLLAWALSREEPAAPV